MDVAVEQEHRPVRDDGVEVLLGGRPTREVLHGPAPADDPGLVRVRRGVASDRGEIVGPTGELVQRDGEPVASRGRRVHVPILKACDHHAAGQVQCVDDRADLFANLGLGPDGDDAAGAHRDRVGPGARPVAAIDVGSGDDEVGGLVHGRHSL